MLIMSLLKDLKKLKDFENPGSKVYLTYYKKVTVYTVLLFLLIINKREERWSN